MSTAPPAEQPDPHAPAVRQHYEAALRHLHVWTDHFFARLLLVQWVACIIIACAVSPWTWSGTVASIHPHVWTALGLGAAIALFPAWQGWRSRGEFPTRALLTVAQMLFSSLLIEITGGRIESHFHIFGSLALLAFYHDLRLLGLAAFVVCTDHLVRGLFWPESIYGVALASPWRSLEHAGWVLFEIVFLAISVRHRLESIRYVATRRAALETENERMERAVQERTGALQESEERLRALFENSPVGLYRATATGELETANPMLLRILGFPSVAHMQQAGILFGSHGMRSERMEETRQLSRHDDLRARDTRWRLADGSLVHLRESVRAFHHADGKLLSIEGSVEDVTERRQLEDRYMQAQKTQAIGQLAGGVAHDFNNILTAILGYADLLLAKSDLSTGPRKHVSEIKRASERAAGLTQQLLAFGRKQTLQPTVLRINSVIRDMHKMLCRLVGEHIKIRLDLRENLPCVKTDAGQLQQVLMNLVVNARDAMPLRGDLTIETGTTLLDERYTYLRPDVAAGHYVTLAVSDNGLGMTPEVRARIFEPFFTTKPIGLGTGLGLATCHGIIKQSGGHIDVYSEPGLGTTLRVYLPITNERPPSEVPRDEAPDWQPKTMGHETILLVEDEPMVRELGTLALTSLGYHVVAANNGVEALQCLSLLGEGKVQLIVTDVVMPEMGGRELAQQVRQRTPDARVLFSSGYTQDAIMRTDLLESGTFFLPKPYTMASLAQKVREVIDWKPGEPVPAAASRSGEDDHGHE